MASCFKNPNKKNLSAKDYTIKKRRSTLFCNLRENALNNIDSGIVPLVTIGNNEACVDKDGIFFKYKNHKSQIDMLAAFEDFRTDLQQVVQGQLFLKQLCSPYHISSNNTGISNNYFPNNEQLAFGDEQHGHVTTYFGALNNTINSNHSEDRFRNTYAEIYTFTPDSLEAYTGGFENNKFLLLKPPVCDNNTRPQILKAGDVPEPQVSQVNILIENDGFNPPEVDSINLIIN
tara:strand:- start:113 stop:808 length:696 start_codon:yes stop_codon:yes gene_type:complete